MKPTKPPKINKKNNFTAILTNANKKKKYLLSC